LPDALRDRYFTHTGPNEWTVHPELRRRVVAYTRVNAMNPDEWGDAAAADVIFCRNMFIYFDTPTVQRVVGAFAERMSRPGYLCIAAAESLLRLSTPFSLEDVGGAFVYVRK
jgi:chemotaxis protein methyltransferase CheR